MAGGALEDVEVHGDLLDGAGSADLDDHLRPIRQCRRVRLADRCRRERDRIQVREQLVQRPAELGLDDPFHDSGRLGRRGILKLRELRDEFGSEHVRARREDLPDFGSGHAEVRDRSAQLDRDHAPPARPIGVLPSRSECELEKSSSEREPVDREDAENRERAAREVPPVTPGHRAGWQRQPQARFTRVLNRIGPVSP